MVLEDKERIDSLIRIITSLVISSPSGIIVRREEILKELRLLKRGPVTVPEVVLDNE